MTLFELSDEALSPVAANGAGSREALYLAAIRRHARRAASGRAGRERRSGAACPRGPGIAARRLRDRVGPDARRSGERPARRAGAPDLARARERGADRGSPPQRERGPPRVARPQLERARARRLPRHEISYASPSVERVLGRTAEVVTGLHLTELMMPGSVTPLARAMVAAPRLTDGPSPLTSLQLSRQDGTAVHAEALITDLTGDANVRGYVLNVRDVTERKEFEDSSSHQAFHDPMTGLANRALFCSRTVHALERQRARHAPVAVLFLDLDDFKAVNDALGHAVGDQLLARGRRSASRTACAPPTPSRASAATSSRSCSRHGARRRRGRRRSPTAMHDLLEQPFALDGRRGLRRARASASRSPTPTTSRR